MEILKNKLSKQLDEQYRFLSAFEDDFEEFYDYCKDIIATQEELFQEIQKYYLGSVKFNQKDNSKIIDIDNILQNTEEILDSLNIVLENNSISFLPFMDEFIRYNACREVLGDKSKDCDLIELKEKEINDTEQILWDNYHYNIKKENESYKNIYIKLNNFEDIIGIGFKENVYNEIKKIIADIDIKLKKDISYFIYKIVHSLQMLDSKQYYDKAVNEWKETLIEMEKSIIDADKKLTILKKDIEKEIKEIDCNFNEYKWLIDRN